MFTMIVFIELTEIGALKRMSSRRMTLSASFIIVLACPWLWLLIGFIIYRQSLILHSLILYSAYIYIFSRYFESLPIQIRQTQSSKMIMVKKQSGYYYSVDQKSQQQPQPLVSPSPNQKVNSNKVPLQIIGNVKGYIQHVAAEVTRIKKLKAEQKQVQMKNKLILDQLSINDNADPDLLGSTSAVKVSISLPKELLEIANRIEALQIKLSSNQLIRQKLQRKGPLSQRTKALQANLQKLSEKSPDILAGSINSFVKNLQQRQQNQKVLFLYDTFTKTNVLTQQIDMLDQYLNNLSQIMRKFKALPPIDNIVGHHQKLLSVREKNKERIRKLEIWMREEYGKVISQIDSI